MVQKRFHTRNEEKLPDRNPILIRNIGSLTDARYFAAMEVDWISMPLSEDPATFLLWHNLRSWISGIRLASELSIKDESLISKAIIDAAPEGLIMDDMEMVHLTGGLDFFLVTDEVNATVGDEVFAQIVRYQSNMPLSHFRSPQRIFLEANWSAEMIEELKRNNYSGGFCFNAVDEDKLGMKDFSMMDELLDCIRR